MAALHGDPDDLETIYFSEGEFFIERSLLGLMGQGLPVNMATSLFMQYPKGMPRDVAMTFARMYTQDSRTKQAMLNKVVLPRGASTRVHLGSGLYHGG